MVPLSSLSADQQRSHQRRSNSASRAPSAAKQLCQLLLASHAMQRCSMCEVPVKIGPHTEGAYTKPFFFFGRSYPLLFFFFLGAVTLCS